MKTFLVIFTALLMSNGVAFAAPTEAAKTAPQHGSHRMEHPIILPFSGDIKATLWLPNSSSQAVSVKGNKVTLPKTGVDNYHVLVAEQQQDNTLSAFIRYIYRHGKPSGHSTSEVITEPKTALEIIPDPIPREHNRYRSAQNWAFMVRFNNEPLTNQTVQLETSHGSTIEQMTDTQGVVSFVIPDDFPNVIAGERDKRKAEFSIHTHHQQAEQQYHTQFSADYFINSKHWQFSSWGAIAIFCGFIGGRLFVHSKHNNKTGDAA